MIKLVRANVRHLATIQPKGIFSDHTAIMETAEKAISNSLAATALGPGGEILAVVGFMPIHDHAGEFWAITSDKCSDYAFTFHRTMKKHLEKFIKDHRLKRVQMIVRSGYTQGFDWAVSLGFNPEGTLRCYGPEGDDYIMMGRVC